MDGQFVFEYAMPWLYIWFTVVSTVNSENLFDLAIYTNMSFLSRLDVVEGFAWNIKGFFFLRDLMLFFSNTKMFQIKKRKKKLFFSKNKSKAFDKEKREKKPFFFSASFFLLRNLYQTNSGLETEASNFWACFERIYCKTHTV